MTTTTREDCTHPYDTLELGDHAGFYCPQCDTLVDDDEIKEW